MIPSRSIFSQVTRFHHYACLATVYSCGLRLQEGLFLEIADIDGSRKMVRIHRGKGAKDRYAPLPVSTYRLLRQSPLSGMPESQDPAVAAKTDGKTTARTPFHGDFHRPFATSIPDAESAEGVIQCPLSGLFRGDEKNRRR